MKCLVDDCDRDAKTRGLCALHYETARQLVYNRETSWKELVQRGKCTDKGRTFGRDARSDDSCDSRY